MSGKNKENSASFLHISGMHPVFFKKALFSDTTENFIDPPEPNPYGTVKISFRSAKNNIDSVQLISEETSAMLSFDHTDDVFDYYSVEVSLNDVPLRYYFKVVSGNIVCFFDATGVKITLDNLCPFVIIPGFHTPKWAKGAVIYQIFTERFCNGDTSNDVESGEYYYVGGLVHRVEDWYKIPAVDGVREFYGGDLQGVINKLDYLKDLGVDAIYFNPLFVSPSNHKYDSQDYEHIDPHFGKIVDDGGECLPKDATSNAEATKYKKRVTSMANLTASDELFASLVERAHSLGIRIILDGVFNHCGSFNKWLDREKIYEESDDFEKGAYVTKDSPYAKYFDFRDQNAWPNNGTYDGWWGYDTLPKLNYEASEELTSHILNIARKWVSKPFNVDGWRLDVAADLGHSPEFNHEFYKKLRRAVKEANPEALILAEHYGDPTSWLNGKEWDSVMNYDAFMEPVTWFLTGMQKHSDDFRGDMLGNNDAFFFSMACANFRFTTPSLQVSMNQLSNHDHSRFLTRTNQKVGRVNSLGAYAADEGVNKAVMRQAVVMQMTWPGAPTIYYGDEAGLTGFTDPDNRRTYPWGREDNALINFHKVMIRIHKENKELLTGSNKFLVSKRNVLGYARFLGADCTVVLINRAEEEITIDVPVWAAVPVPEEGLERIMLSVSDGYITEPENIPANGGKVKVTLPPVSAMVLRSKRSEKTEDAIPNS